MTSATVSVSPSSITVPIDQNLTISLTISGVSDLYGWEIQLTWNSTLLDALDASEGQFLKAAGSTFFNYDVNATEGSMFIECTLTGDIPGVNGDGTLATVTFESLALAGSVSLHLADVELSDPNSNSIYCSSSDGTVTVIRESHEVAVVGVETTKTIVGQGYSVNITATVEDLGSFSEIFNTTIYAGTIALYTQTVNLESGASMMLFYTWTTYNFAYGNYSISAYASPVPGETNTANNNCTGGWVIVSIPGDITGPNGFPDGKVDMRDVAYVAKRFGATPGSPFWDPNADINGDGKIDMKDVAIVAKNFGQHIDLILT
jgi:hypothetical protein